MAISKIDSDGITAGGITADSLDIGQIGGRRNLIINGAMQVAQRGTSFTSAITSGHFTVDRFNIQSTATDELAVTTSQSTTVPSGQGFSSSIKIDVTTAESALAADELFRCIYKIEAQDLQQLSYGTSDAKSLTLSFWVRSNVTGTYAWYAYQEDGVRVIGGTYSISSADTWEKKEVTIAGDTSGTINNDTGTGLWIVWGLAAGSNFTGTSNTSWASYATSNLIDGQAVNLMDTIGNNFYITGVQLEVGSVATPFEHRSYGEELALCQRYYQEGQIMNSGNINASAVYSGYSSFPVEMRASPTMTSGTFTSIGGGGFTDTTVTWTPSTYGVRGQQTAGGNTNGGGFVRAYTASAEL